MKYVNGDDRASPLCTHFMQTVQIMHNNTVSQLSLINWNMFI